MAQSQKHNGYVTSAGKQYVGEVNVVPIRRDAQARPFTTVGDRRPYLFVRS